MSIFLYPTPLGNCAISFTSAYFELNIGEFWYNEIAIGLAISSIAVMVSIVIYL